MNAPFDSETFDDRVESRPRDLLLQRVPLDRPAPVRPLYWRMSRDESRCTHGVDPDGAGGLTIQPGVTLAFDTYFGGLFEPPWRLYTAAGAFTLSLRLQGRARLLIRRRQPAGATSLLHDQLAEGDTAVELPHEMAHFRQSGLIWFELTALDRPVTLHQASWHANATPRPIGLAVVICTFNREAALGPVLDAIAADPALAHPIPSVIVVNQGRQGLASHPALAQASLHLANRLRIVEQPNFGGAGGFGRGLLEALDDPAITHVCFLDDDVRIEPESLARMATFFALVHQAGGHDEVTLGGHMLDSIAPATLYEAGAIVLPNGALQPLDHRLDLAEAESLTALLDVSAMHYNGWWMFGFDKRLVATIGMPLPCFIRGDDVEWGLRLHAHGIPTVPIPGVGIWHEPFYLKIGGWQLYYETRNALIAMALHDDFTPRRVAPLMAKRLLTYLLTYRYYGAALVIRAMQDFMAGPAILDRDPRPLHAGLAELRTRHPEHTTRREQVVSPATVRLSPRFHTGFLIDMAVALWRNWTGPTRPHDPLQRLDVQNLVWFRIIGNDALAVDTWWDRDLPTLRRDRATFRTLLTEGIRTVWRLARAARFLQTAWRQDAPRLSSIGFWRTYLARR